MKILKSVGGSIAMLYLVCAVFFIAAVGNGPSLLVPQAHADTSETLAKAAEVAQVAALIAANNKQVKTEPVAEQSIVDETADKIPNWFVLLSSLITVAGAIAAATPSPKDNAVLGVVRKVLDIFALNFGGAKNAAADKGKAKGVW